MMYKNLLSEKASKWAKENPEKRYKILKRFAEKHELKFGCGRSQNASKPCPHGILRRSKCKICKREIMDKYRLKKGIKVGIGRGNNDNKVKPQLCPHGNLGIGKCKKCKVEYNKNWGMTHPKERKLQQKRHNNKRKRNLGFDIIWEPEIITESMNYHHIDNKCVVCIPNWLNNFISHNINTGKNMDIINNLAFEYIEIQNRRLD